MIIRKITPAVGAVIEGVDFSKPMPAALQDDIYRALLDNLVIFFPQAHPSPADHLAFAQQFGDLDEPHPLYPHVEGHDNIVLLQNDAKTPPDTNSWHTDLTFKAEQPFASILVARTVPECGGDTLWASLYAAYERLPDGMKRDLEKLEAIHDLGDFRNTIGLDSPTKSGEQRLNETMAAWGHQIRPLIDEHPVTGRKFLNFNEAFVTHIMGLTTNESNALRTYLANHMNRPELQMRWHWTNGDIAMWDNRVTMHYAVADYLPQFRSMNRITVLRDRRAKRGRNAAA